MASLDTSALLDLNGKGGQRRLEAIRGCIARLLAVGEKMVTTRFAVAELWVGIERSKGTPKEQTERQQILRLLQQLPILEFDARGARAFGRITAHLQRIGRPAGDMDVLIASVSLVERHSLVTANPSHFANIPDLSVHAY